MMIHNDYISTLVETGFIGFIVFLFWHYRWFDKLIEAYKSTSKNFDRAAIFGVLIVLSSIMVMRITDNILLDTYDMYPLSALIAAALSIPHIRRNELNDEAQLNSSTSN